MGLTPSLTYSFTSGSTLIASEINENNASVEDWLTGNSYDLNVNQIEIVNSCNVTSDIAANSAVFSDIITASEISFESSETTVNSNIINKKYGLGVGAWDMTWTAQKLWVASSSYSLSALSDTISRLTMSPNQPGSAVTAYPKELIIVMSVVSGNTVVIETGAEVSNTNWYGFKLGAATRTLDSPYDKLVVQLSKDAYSGLYYWHEISFKDQG